MPDDVPAHVVSVGQTLDLLDGPFAGLAEGVADGSYALWLGSGISLARVDGLRGVIRRVLRFVRAQVTDDEACPYRQGLADIVRLAAASGVTVDDVDFTASIDDWPGIDRLVDALLAQYSAMLDVRIGHEKGDYLLWDGVNVIETYATKADRPDVEHFCVAILIAEGVAPHIATANWDGLVETAIEELGYQVDDLLKVCILSEDFQLPDLRSRMVKFHGCARRAAAEPDRYRKLLIARKSQISRWRLMPEYLNAAAEIISMAANRRTLMVGLSAQDEDIQQIFVEADQRSTWSWGDRQPPHAFAEEELGSQQMNILKALYDDEFDEHGPEILQRSKIRAYAKSLLVGLVLDVLSRKLTKHLGQAPSAMDSSERDRLSAGIVTLRDLVASSCNKDDELAFMERFLETSKSLGATFDSGTAPGQGGRYRPIGSYPVHQIPSDPGLESNGMRELAVALALIGLGHAATSWEVQASAAGAPGGLVLASDAFGKSRVFLCADLEAGERLFEGGTLSVDSGDAVIMYSRGRLTRRRRHPSGRRGRTGQAQVREVGITDLLSMATSAEDLESRFAEAVVA
jgi:hypothetical protein